MVKQGRKKIKKQIKQKVKVSQNVKVIVGDVKKRQARKSTGPKQPAKSAPPIVLNISNPQPYNNPYMMYFKEQLQNQQPIKSTTMRENEIQVEKQENKQIKVGGLQKLHQEPNDVARELRRQAAETRANIKRAEMERDKEIEEMRSSLKPVSQRQISPAPLRPRQPSQRELLMSSIRANVPETPAVNLSENETENEMLNNMSNQTQQLEYMMTGNGYEGDEEEEIQDIQPVQKKRGRPAYTEEQKQQAKERKQMQDEDPYEKALRKEKREEKKALKLRQLIKLR